MKNTTGAYRCYFRDMPNHHLLVTMDYPPVPGGISLYLSRLWEHAGFDRSVLMTGALQPYPDPAPYEIRYARLPAGKSKFIRFLRVSLMFPLLIRTVAGRKNLILHCGQIFVCGFPAALISLFTGLRFTVYTYAADVYACQDRIFQRAALRFILRRAGLVVTISRYTMDILVKSGCPKDKISLITPGVDMPSLVPPGAIAAMQQRINRPGARIILTVARLVRRKGHETIIRALPRILETHPDVLYVVAGDGPHKPRLQAAAGRLKQKDRVVFLGQVSDEERCALYQLCDLFALVPFEDGKTKEVEGFGIVYLEANSFGRPVVGSRSGGIPDAVDEGVSGLLVPPLDDKEFARAAASLLGDASLASRLGEGGRKRLAGFMWPVKAGELETALRVKGLF